MKILSIDPGYHTGIVVLVDGIVAVRQTVTYHWRSVLDAVIKNYMPDAVVIERAPALIDSREQKGRVTAVINFVGDHVSDITPIMTIAPGDYKPISRAQEWAKEVKLKTQHEIDAYCMARWYQTFHATNPFVTKETKK